jgi:type VI protein secretion system component VasK
MELIDYAEKKADELMSAHIGDMEALAKETHVTFAFIVALLSGVFGYLLKLVDPHLPLEHQQWLWIIPVTALLIHLFVLGWHLVTNTMLASWVHHKGNEPKNLLNEEIAKIDLLGVRWAECLNLQTRIEKNRARNVAAATALNRVRKWLLLAPVTFSVAWVLALLVRQA